jgi:hypothetical protein
LDLPWADFGSLGQPDRQHSVYKFGRDGRLVDGIGEREGTIEIANPIFLAEERHRRIPRSDPTVNGKLMVLVCQLQVLGRNARQVAGEHKFVLVFPNVKTGSKDDAAARGIDGRRFRF